ncbi:KUP/HAK/KT family potassium transporter [Maridesulfovibrio sp.]|uniref:KUP/HAK/KT family potassium transporter n=1 Tax=Maridesulfovibrio sp. TaxID=2795000 RepID=UPI003B0076BC
MTLKPSSVSLFPKMLTLPVVALATLAAIIASQAIISGVFSLTAQAVHLGFIPRIRILQTSEDNPGQVFVRSVNWLMAGLCILLVIVFKTPGIWLEAYGIADYRDHGHYAYLFTGSTCARCAIAV